MKQILLIGISVLLLTTLTVSCTVSGVKPLQQPKSNPGGTPKAGVTPSPVSANRTSTLPQSGLLLKATESGTQVTADNGTDTANASDHQPMVTLCINVVPDDGGSTTPDSCTSYESGTLVTLTAKPAPCHYFQSWGGDIPAKVDKKSPKITITMDKTRNVIASMPYIKYNLTVTVIGVDCAVTPSKGSYNCGSMVTLVATPEINFGSWSGDPSIVYPQNPVVTITMDSNKNITATFYPPAKDCIDCELN